MTSLSTHVLDTMHGRPAAGMAVALSGPDGEISRGTTNADGRCPDLAPAGLAPGRYALRFSVADYYRGLGVALPDPPFLDEVKVDFGISAGRRPLSRAPARLALRLFDLPGQLIDDGRRPRRMAQSRAQMAASDRGHRLDRLELLFRLARQSSEGAGRGRRLGRAVVGPRRRLLPQPEIPGRAGRRCPSSCTGSNGRPISPGSAASRCAGLLCRRAGAS